MKSPKSVFVRLCGGVITLLLVAMLAAVNVFAAIDTPLIPLQPDSTGASESKENEPTKTETGSQEKNTEPKETVPAGEEKQTTEKTAEIGKKNGCNSGLSASSAVLILTVFGTFACRSKRSEEA